MSWHVSLAALEERGQRGVVPSQRLGHRLGEREDHLAVQARLDLVLAVLHRLQLGVRVHGGQSGRGIEGYRLVHNTKHQKITENTTTRPSSLNRKCSDKMGILCGHLYSSFNQNTYL